MSLDVGEDPAADLRGAPAGLSHLGLDPFQPVKPILDIHRLTDAIGEEHERRPGLDRDLRGAVFPFGRHPQRQPPLFGSDGRHRAGGIADIGREVAGVDEGHPVGARIEDRRDEGGEAFVPPAPADAVVDPGHGADEVRLRGEAIFHIP